MCQASDVDQVKDDLHERINQRCREAAGGCWIYGGGTMIRVLGQAYTVARAAAWAYLGGFDLDDPDVRVLHPSCGNPSCVNFEHLEVARGRRLRPANRLLPFLRGQRCRPAGNRKTVPA